VKARRDASPGDYPVEYRALFEAAPDGIILVGERGEILDANPCVLKMFGYEREALVGRAVEALVPSRLHETHLAERGSYMSAPRARPMGIGLELSGCRRDGSEFPVEISLSPMAMGGERHVICVVRDVTERLQLRAFGASALRAAEEERQRIARELHDDTAQRLAGLMLLLRAAQKIEDREERDQRIERVREEIAATAEGVRRIARGLRPPVLDEVGLVSALDSLVRSLGRAHSLDIELAVERVGERLDADAELALYRIVQEALTNAIRHSGASRIVVSLDGDGLALRASVEDDGRGFVPERDYGEAGRGLGLVGMRERARNAGGRLEIASARDGGTRVSAELPLRRRTE
jgi:PAS domain S-box-containing protein